MENRIVHMADPAAPRSPSSFVPVVGRLLCGSFREGAGYRVHRPDGTTDWLLLYSRDGIGRVSHGPAADTVLVPGRAALIAPRTGHDYGIAAGADHWDLLFAHFHPSAHWLTLLEWPRAADGIGVIDLGGPAGERVVSGLVEAAWLQHSAYPRAEMLALNALERVLLWCDTKSPRGLQLDERIVRALDLAERAAPRRLSIADLAAASTLSPSRFAHLFREQLGTSPHRYLERLRIARAQQLLDMTNRSVASVAADLEIEDPLYFSAWFRAKTGLSPTAYRGRHDRVAEPAPGP